MINRESQHKCVKRIVRVKHEIIQTSLGHVLVLLSYIRSMFVCFNFIFHTNYENWLILPKMRRQYVTFSTLGVKPTFAYRERFRSNRKINSSKTVKMKAATNRLISGNHFHYIYS